MDRKRTLPSSAILIAMESMLDSADNDFIASSSEVLDAFEVSDDMGWQMFCDMPWSRRNDVIALALKQWSARNDTEHAVYLFLKKYKAHVEPFFRDDFYDVVENRILDFNKQYRTCGEINVPLLKLSCLSDITAWCEHVENKGRSRYDTTRTVYPPGEVKGFAEDDPRKNIRSEVNMVAVASRHMRAGDTVQWIYHSPHLQRFVQGIMDLTDIYPYESDLGVAVNIMRPQEGAKTALGFHFDTIDSSIQVDDSGNQNSRGATGVIGIHDCTKGGERLTFPTVSRDKVSQVRSIVEKFDPMCPSTTIDDCVPVVVQEPIAGVLSVFNGGNMLHAVSSVQEGLRVATVFLYAESRTETCESTRLSANAFYGDEI